MESEQQHLKLRSGYAKQIAGLATSHFLASLRGSSTEDMLR